jgi:nicotinamidase-related amidase
MHPGSTLFLDVGAQRDFSAGGAWPLLSGTEVGNMASLFDLAADLGIRQGGSVCLHRRAGSAESAPGPRHCLHGSPGAERLPSCRPALPVALCDAEASGDRPALDREHAFYVGSGCAAAPDAMPAHRRVFEHLTAGIRDAVVFGAGLEYGIDREVDALLRRRIRTHVVLDAAAAADPSEAQIVIARWKHRGVDGVTTATLRRLLVRG